MILWISCYVLLGLISTVGLGYYQEEKYRVSSNRIVENPGEYVVVTVLWPVLWFIIFTSWLYDCGVALSIKGRKE